MTLAQIAASPSARITLVMALLYGVFGIAMPYLPRWLDETRGLSSFEIAVVLSAAQMSRIVVGPLIATWADGFRDRSFPIKLLAFAALCMHAGLFLVDGFWALFLMSFAAGTCAQAIVPLAEGGALRASLRPDGLPYGPCRAFGSSVFIVGGLIAASAVSGFGVAAVPVAILAMLSGVVLAAVFGLHHDPSPGRALAMGYRGRLRLGVGLLRNRAFALAVGAAAAVQASHAFFYAFTSLVWRDQGIGELVIVLLIATGVAVEILLLLFLPRIEKRFLPEVMIALGAVAAIVRWGAFALGPPVWILWPLQALHALTFAATHVGAMRLIQREAPEEVSGLAQTLYAALASGLFMGLSSLASGELHHLFGAAGYGAMALLGAIGLGLIAPAVLRAR